MATAASACLNKLTSDSYSAAEGALGLPRWTAEHGPKLKMRILHLADG